MYNFNNLHSIKSKGIFELIRLTLNTGNIFKNQIQTNPNPNKPKSQQTQIQSKPKYIIAM